MKQTYTLRRTLSAVLLFLVSSLAWAYHFEVNGIYYNIFYDSNTGKKYVSVTDRSHYSGDIVIPSTVSYGGQTYSVKSIENYAFSNCVFLTSVVIEDGVTSIGDKAFEDCSSLTSIDIPKSVKIIRSFAFYGCSSLTAVVISESVTSIREWAFEDCTSLATVICLAEKIPNIRRNAFGSSSSEATLYVPASAIEDYKAAEMWKDFGTILPIEGNEDIIDGIDSSVAQPDDGNGNEDSAAPYYTLDGKPISTPVHGRIYVRGGKKVLY